MDDLRDTYFHRVLLDTELVVAQAKESVQAHWGAFQKWAKCVTQSVVMYAVDYKSISKGISTEDARNAVDHAAASALLTYEVGAAMAKAMGDVKEMGGSLTNVVNTQRDSWKDQWNNAVGRRIGEFVESHKIKKEDIGDIVLDALRTGQLVVQVQDHRIVLSQDPLPMWNGPSAEWLDRRQQKVATR